MNELMSILMKDAIIVRAQVIQNEPSFKGAVTVAGGPR